MIKKIIACLTICFIITGIISPVFSDASALPQPNWTDPGISEIINISDLTGWMLNGGTFDVSTYTDAESFMNDYFNARTQTRLVSPGEAQEDYYEVFSGFGINNQLVAGESFARPLETNRVIASSFRDHTGYGRRLSNEVNEALLSTGNLYDTKIPLLNEVEFANFVGYNHDALRLYSEFFTDPDTPTPNPEAEYIPYIDLINGAGFSSWLNVNQPWTNYFNTGKTTNLYWGTDYSYFYINRLNSPNPNNGTNLYWQNLQMTNLKNVYIYGSDNSYSFTIVSDPLTNFLSGRNNNYYDNSNVRQSWYDSNNNEYQASMNNSNSNLGSLTWNYSGTLLNVFKVLSSACHNINIYVNDELWAGTGTATPTITPEFPDAVGGEDLPTTTWPVHRPIAPYFITAPGMLQAIQDAIDDDGELDIDDLKPYLTDENGDPVPDPQFDPEPIPIPVPDTVNPDVVPGLPNLPAMPPEMPGFSGVSVLAEIINFTNQSLPTSLIVTFWGIVFGIVIIGLIKILHK